MSPATTPTGEGPSNAPGVPARLRHLVQAPRVDISIKLASRKQVFTTLDKIEGVASVTATADTYFDDVEIEFVGTARTFLERLTTAAAASGRSEAFHQFLKLTQPGLQDHYPEANILKAGQTYDFPFVFGVPQQLLPRICQHKVQSPSVRDAHLQLPPTFGDKDFTDQPGELNDMAPDMASVRYGVFAKVSKVKSTDEGASRVSLASRAKKLRISPAVDEEPPLDAGGKDSEYVMRKEKMMRKGMLKGKLGTLVMEASQPPSLRMKPNSNHDSESRTTTMATVMLRFDPADENAQPPRLNCMNSKLKVVTFFASSARQSFPTKNASSLDLSQGIHTEQLQLSSRCMANVEWTRHQAEKPASSPTARRDSATSFSGVGIDINAPQPSEHYKGKTYYTARLLVPLTLPNHKAFVPTFHSCLVSRQYALKLDLSISGTGGIAPSLDLKLPIQISQAGRQDNHSPERPAGAPPAISPEEEAAESESIYDFFERRAVGPPAFSSASASASSPSSPSASASQEGQQDPRTQSGSRTPPEQRRRTRSRAPVGGGRRGDDADEAPPGYSVLPPGAQRMMRGDRSVEVAAH
ncbi:hypothetical protein KC332_g15028 [Hortaea werneckii]|uniref:Arrestin-like N-terminal domain-containing protein n=2 Tax=Hortaea werneckii TaxID=91943 RepID=A0A3M7ITR7_HORWE|nr:hypothetical protein KC358_g10374 [Hortaea werneckii]OTA33471.1 hypothetical protein BTJ68_05629 [Hortaea werneckii EXF-2000]KAI6821298.1 hypothetical protein KC350_g9630 [Hortaea werneckii]KAI6918677.1 hypothetical protein KC348_g10848 [Hortaea werneckii]KAI6929989.1 hypothetical protein KC341_g10513 [Hortaea werneckii]